MRGGERESVREGVFKGGREEGREREIGRQREEREN